MRNIYYAKSKLPNGKQPTNKEHLEKVSQLAGLFGAEIGCKQEAMLAGQLHDFGKYSERFQDVLYRTLSNIDHAVCGAAMLYAVKEQHQTYQPIIEAINGHHDGLLEFGMLSGRSGLLENVLRSNTKQTANAGKTSALNGILQYKEAIRAFLQDFPDYKVPKLSAFLPADSTDVAQMLYTRMLFSCLVDADYSVSASDVHDNYLEETSRNNFDPQKLLKKLYDHRESIRNTSRSANDVNQIRDMLFEQCGKTGEESESGLFTLTAPTGTGKTLSLLHFALRHCSKHGKRRIIVVLPFLALADQTADKTYCKIFPDVLVDHSQSDLPDDARVLAARWSAPVIITTSVKFFESLFAYRPTDCRKLHNIANSVVIFDEAQSLPTELTRCTLQAVRELCDRYRCTIVFSTATQPDFHQLDKAWRPTEIMPDNIWMYEALRRVHISWNLESATTLEQIANQIATKTNVCAIVNLRKHARKLFEILKERCPAERDGIFFLTTDLCPAHRSEIIRKINLRQHDNLPCRVVSTQCIEAGVDLDFDVLYRALAPLDSIIQAVGRCNRNGRLPQQGGNVIVFIPDEEDCLYPDRWYQNAAQIVSDLKYDCSIDLDDPSCIQKYYKILYKNQNDNPKLSKAIFDHCFAETDKQYKLIENKGIPVIVRFIGHETCYDYIAEQIKTKGISRQLIKEAAPITVTTFERNIEQYAEQISLTTYNKSESTPSGYYILREQFKSCYTEDMGLQFKKTGDVDFTY